MFKRALMLAIAFGALIPFCWQPAQSMVYRIETEDTLYRLAQLSGAAPAELNVQGWTRVAEEFVTVGELQDLVREVASRLGNANPELTQEDGQDFREVRVQSVIGERTVLNIAAQSLVNFSSPEQGGETYITVSIVQNVADKKAYWADEVKEALSRMGGMTPQVLTNLVATVPGEMAADRREQVAADIFHAAKAEISDGINSGDLCSYTGYSPKIPGSITVGGKEVNLNIALRYHNVDGQTYIFIGSPLLIGEY